MRFNQHSLLKGTHSALSASQPAWLRYEDDKFDRWYKLRLAAQRGTELHELASSCIKLGQRLPDDTTMGLYVNHAIDFNMTPEQILFYSPHAYGTADAIGFEDNFLRIHDLKTGTSHASEEQLFVYAAYFCLEYGMKPKHIDGELRIYQENSVFVWELERERVQWIMGRIVSSDARIDAIRLDHFGR